MPTGRLKLEGWAKVMALYPDSEVTSAIMGICKYGVRIGYEGIREEPTIYPNLATAEADIDLVTADIAYELSLDRLHTYPNQESLPTHYTASPLGLTDKSDGSKRRIHHLSYPTTGTSSINAGIPEEYGTIAYSGINDAILAIQNMGTGSLLVKRDFESAFRHIPVSPLDSPLLGFQWQGRYYSECFLPFGLRTAPYLFNLFSEAFHWILQEELGTQELPGRIIHYLDDFLIVIPPDSNPTNYTRVFAKLCTELGLSIKESKNKEGTMVDFAGVELDTRRMVIRLPMKKLLKGREIVDSTIEKKSISLLELQQITGYLTFASTVVPLGRTFLRRLYNLQIYFPPGSGHQRRRISSEAHKDLAWWAEVLSDAPQRSIALHTREIICTWSDAASTKGLGAYFTSPAQPYPQPDSVLSIALPYLATQANEHINTQEMRAVEQILLYWGRSWEGKRIVMHTDNRAVFYGLAKGTIRGASMTVLRRCLLLATEYDLELQPIWIPTNENALADALSRFDHDRVTNLAPQLLSQSCNLPNHGLRTYSNRDYQQ